MCVFFNLFKTLLTHTVRLRHGPECHIMHKANTLTLTSGMNVAHAVCLNSNKETAVHFVNLFEVALESYIHMSMICRLHAKCIMAIIIFWCAEYRNKSCFKTYANN